MRQTTQGSSDRQENESVPFQTWERGDEKVEEGEK